jgi:protocatechuate 3,4-dioxygenase beta subunit
MVLCKKVSLHLIFHIYGVDDNDRDGVGSCTLLNDAKVDIWHANSQGVYSGV